PELNLVIDEDAISENGGTSQATVSRNTESLDALVVMLSSDDTTEATVPSSVTIPAGAPSVSFTISGVDDTIVGEDVSVQIFVSANLHTSDNQAILISEDDSWSWTNAKNRYDVNDDGFLSPIDALLIINYLNNASNSELPPLEDRPPSFFDVSEDGFASPIDALMVVNRLNSPGGDGEGVWRALALLESELDSERPRRSRAEAVDRYFDELQITLGDSREGGAAINCPK
ncbi:MAG: dockerin type I domain-containing protein, partial [Planctomycetota bacterium]